jgi:hypothetical protein
MTPLPPAAAVSPVAPLAQAYTEHELLREFVSTRADEETGTRKGRFYGLDWTLVEAAMPILGIYTAYLDADYKARKDETV